MDLTHSVCALTVKLGGECRVSLCERVGQFRSEGYPQSQVQLLRVKGGANTCDYLPVPFVLGVVQRRNSSKSPIESTINSCARGDRQTSNFIHCPASDWQQIVPPDISCGNSKRTTELSFFKSGAMPLPSSRWETVRAPTFCCILQLPQACLVASKLESSIVSGIEGRLRESE